MSGKLPVRITVDPGGARFGNFTYYYRFNPVEKRLCHLPPNVIESCLGMNSDENKSDEGLEKPVLCLDIGCNSGDLTDSLHQLFSKPLVNRTLKILGVDLDVDLIERASEKYRDNEHLSFCHLDLMNDVCEEKLSDFVAHYQSSSFRVVFCFSVTMWIHLHHGDEGLRIFFDRVSKFGDFLIVEPQPWKCYRSASRRMRKLNLPDFKTLDSIKHKEQDLLPFLDKVIQSVGFERSGCLGDTHWNRPLWIYRNRFR